MNESYEQFIARIQHLIDAHTHISRASMVGNTSRLGRIYKKKERLSLEMRNALQACIEVISHDKSMMEIAESKIGEEFTVIVGNVDACIYDKPLSDSRYDV